MPRSSHLLTVGALVLVAACAGALSDDRPGYEGATGPLRPVETQLRGKVIDIVTLQPVAGVSVRIDTLTSLSTADGTYTLQRLTMLAATLEATKVGYDTARSFIPLAGGDRSFDVRIRASVTPP